VLCCCPFCVVCATVQKHITDEDQPREHSRQSILTFNVSDYASRNFNVKGKGAFWDKDLDVKSLMQWSKV
jgi:hypothetical protein